MEVFDHAASRLVILLGLNYALFRITGQVRVFSTRFEKNKGQKVKLKGHQYSFLAALRVFIRVASTHFWP